MKNYIALKPCRFQGVNYKIGEKISEEIIGKKTVGGLVSMEFIKEVSPTEKICDSTKNSEEKISQQKNSEPEKILQSEEIKKPKKKLKVGEENDIQLQS